VISRSFASWRDRSESAVEVSAGVTRISRSFLAWRSFNTPPAWSEWKCVMSAASNAFLPASRRNGVSTRSALSHSAVDSPPSMRSSLPSGKRRTAASPCPTSRKLTRRQFSCLSLLRGASPRKAHNDQDKQSPEIIVPNLLACLPNFPRCGFPSPP